MQGTLAVAQTRVSTKAVSTALVVILVLLSQGINGSDFGLPGYVTGKRVGLVLLTVLLFKQSYKAWPTPTQISWLIASLLLGGSWVFLSLFVTEGAPAAGLGEVAGWFLVAYSVYALDWLFPRILSTEKQHFLEGMAIAGSALTLATVVWLVVTKGPGVFLSMPLLRVTMDQISQGLSRYMNGLLFVNAFSIAVALGMVASSFCVYWFCLSGSVAFGLLAALSGSRQTMGAIVLYVLLLLVLQARCVRLGSNSVRRQTRPRWPLVLAGLVVAAFGVTKVLDSDIISASVMHRLSDTTYAQLKADDNERTMVLEDAWAIGRKHPWFGVGPLLFHSHPENRTGLMPHNGYLDLLLNGGLPAVVAIAGSLLALLLWAWANLRRAVENGHADIACLSISFLLVFLLWSVNFNDILREYMPFITLGILIYAIMLPRAEGFSEWQTVS